MIASLMDRRAAAVAAAVADAKGIAARGGVTRETLERIKKPYFTTRKGGTGLGIAVARGLIEQHGGKLEYSSELGKGTVAKIELPVCSLKAKMAKHLPNPAREGESPSPAPAAELPKTPAVS